MSYIKFFNPSFRSQKERDNEFVMIFHNYNYLKIIQRRILPVIIPISEKDPIKNQPGMENVTYTKKRGYLLVFFYFET